MGIRRGVGRYVSRLARSREMGEEGLEPSCLSAPEPKSGASTSSATRPACPTCCSPPLGKAPCALPNALRAVLRTHRNTPAFALHYHTAAAALLGRRPVVKESPWTLHISIRRMGP